MQPQQQRPCMVGQRLRSTKNKKRNLSRLADGQLGRRLFRQKILKIRRHLTSRMVAQNVAEHLAGQMFLSAL
jgi:hypothetical protein